MFGIWEPPNNSIRDLYYSHISDCGIGAYSVCIAQALLACDVRQVMTDPNAHHVLVIWLLTLFLLDLAVDRIMPGWSEVRIKVIT